jgi:hypothetical protein
MPLIVLLYVLVARVSVSIMKPGALSLTMTVQHYTRTCVVYEQPKSDSKSIFTTAAAALEKRSFSSLLSLLFTLFLKSKKQESNSVFLLLLRLYSLLLLCHAINE